MVVLLVIYLLAQVYISTCTSLDCDASKDVVQEGINGQTAALSWLGILRVYLYEGKTLKIALTGIVLVKEGYAIANADDISRIPKNYLAEKSKAMFIPTPDTPWYCTVKDYITHPEYQYTTMNSLALLELEDNENIHFPMRPICWPPFNLVITKDLYAFGYTDENQSLEKSVYKVQHVYLTICKEIYNRVGFTEDMLAPKSFVCGFAPSHKGECVWDNGMVLASNSTGYWRLVGFGVQGPGCSAPARFINMMDYLHWIEASIDQYDVNDNFKRSGFGSNKTKEIRVYDLFSSNEMQGRSVWYPESLEHYYNSSYSFDTEQYQDRYYNIERIDRDNIVIWAENVAYHHTGPYKHGNCSSNGYSHMVYKDDDVIKSRGNDIEDFYKLSVMDLNEINFTCVDIKVTPQNLNSKATIFYGVEIDNTEGMSVIEDLSSGLRKTYGRRPTPQSIREPHREEWVPRPNTQMKYIYDKYYVIKQQNLNILLRLAHKSKVSFHVVLYGDQPFTEQATDTTKKRRIKGGKKPQFRREGDPFLNATGYLTKSFDTIYNELINSDLQKTIYFGVYEDVDEGRRTEERKDEGYMKETILPSSSATGVADVGVSFAHYLFIIAMFSFV